MRKPDLPQHSQDMALDPFHRNRVCYFELRVDNRVAQTSNPDLSMLASELQWAWNRAGSAPETRLPPLGFIAHVTNEAFPRHRDAKSETVKPSRSRRWLHSETTPSVSSPFPPKLPNRRQTTDRNVAKRCRKGHKDPRRGEDTTRLSTMTVHRD